MHARAIAAAAPIHRSAGFEQAGAQVGSAQQQSQQNLLMHIAELTCGCVAFGGLAEDNEGTWIWEVTDVLLEAWVELLAEDSFSPKAR